MKLTYSYVALAFLATFASAVCAAPVASDEALNTLQQEGQRRDAGALKHKESACGGKGTGGRIGPSGCRYTNGEDEPGKKIAPNTRTMKPDSSPKRTEAQRKEAIQSFAHEDVSYSAFRQDDPNFPRGQNGAHEPRAFEDPDGQTGSDAHDDEDVNARLKHERDSEYSSPWLEVTHEGAHPKDGVKDNAKHGEESQSEHHHCPQYQHHHHHNNARDNDAFDVSHSAGTNDGKREEGAKSAVHSHTDSHDGCKDHQHVHDHREKEHANCHLQGHDDGETQQKPEGNSFAAQNYTW